MLNTVRHKYFWSNHFLEPKEKLSFYKKVKLFDFLIYILWFLALLVIVLAFTMQFEYSKFVYNNEWPLIIRKLASFLIFVFVTGCYYAGNTNLCYCVYMILQSYFQMLVLRSYIMKALKKYKNVTFEKKIFDSRYQWKVQLIFKRCIRQYQKIKWLLYNRKKIFFVTENKRL